MTFNHPLGQQDVAFIRPGETKWDEVMDRLGAPNQLIETPNGVAANYFYYDTKRFDADFGSVAGLFLPPGASEAPHQLDFTNAGTGTRTFQVSFDHNGTVLYDGFSRNSAASAFKASPF